MLRDTEQAKQLRKEQSWKTHISDFKTSDKGIVAKTTLDWHNNRNIDDWNGHESPEMNPFIYG